MFLLFVASADQLRAIASKKRVGELIFFGSFILLLMFFPNFSLSGQISNFASDFRGASFSTVDELAEKLGRTPGVKSSTPIVADFYTFLPKSEFNRVDIRWGIAMDFVKTNRAKIVITNDFGTHYYEHDLGMVYSEVHKSGTCLKPLFEVQPSDTMASPKDFKEALSQLRTIRALVMYSGGTRQLGAVGSRYDVYDSSDCGEPKGRR